MMHTRTRRLAKLEAVLQPAMTDQWIDDQIAAMQPEIIAACEQHGFGYAEAEAEVRSVLQRFIEVGETAFYQEWADKYGCTVEVARDPKALAAHKAAKQAEYDAWLADVRSKQVYWRAGVKYTGGFDDAGRPDPGMR